MVFGDMEVEGGGGGEMILRREGRNMI